MSKRKREDERPDETPVTVIELQATIYTHNRPAFVTFANANSDRFQYGIIYSIFSCLIPRNSEFLAILPPNFLIWGDSKKFFSSPPNCGPGLRHCLRGFLKHNSIFHMPPLSSTTPSSPSSDCPCLSFGPCYYVCITNANIELKWIELNWIYATYL